MVALRGYGIFSMGASSIGFLANLALKKHEMEKEWISFCPLYFQYFERASDRDFRFLGTPIFHQVGTRQRWMRKRPLLASRPEIWRISKLMQLLFLKEPQVIERTAFSRIGYVLITANTQVYIHFVQHLNFN